MSDAPALLFSVQGFVSSYFSTVGLSFAAHSDNLATGDQEKQTHIAKIRQQSRNKDKNISLRTAKNCHLFSIQRLRLSEEFYSRFTLHIRRRRCTASISSCIPIQKQSPTRRCARIGGTRFLLQSRVPRLLHSRMHQWDPTGSKSFLVAAPSPHSQQTHTLLCAHETTSSHANDPQTWMGHMYACIPFY